jgi:hypothetical protein
MPQASAPPAIGFAVDQAVRPRRRAHDPESRSADSRRTVGAHGILQTTIKITLKNRGAPDC